MKAPSRTYALRLLALALLLLAAVVIFRQRPAGPATPAAGGFSAESPTSGTANPAGSSVSDPGSPGPASVVRDDGEPRPLENEFEKRLLGAAVTLATSESRDPSHPARTVKSRLLRTPFKYPHVRSDETWEDTPGNGTRLVKRDLYVADHVMVRFPAAMTPAEVAAWCQGQGFVLRHRLRTEPVYLVATGSAELGSTGLLLEAVRKSFGADQGDALAERDALVFPALAPNDPSLGQLWGLHNTGQTGGTADADIDAPEAWEFSTGSADVVVAVIDTGVDANHPDLRDNIRTNPGEIAANGIDDDGNGFIDDVQGWDFYANDNAPTDENGHGTHCAGTIGATGNNGTGVAGVCWDVAILPVRFLGPVGGSTSDGIESVNYATALGVDLTSNSWGGGSYSTLLEQAIAGANSAGILFVAAAGNDATNNDSLPHYPSSYIGANVISVASTTATDALSSFSNYGKVGVDLAAPGSSIYSTLPGNQYGIKSGTSMATPHVSGALALLRSMSPGMDHLQLKQHLLDNTDLLPALATITSSGGRLNLAKAAAPLSGPRVVASTARVEITGGNGDPYLNPGEQGEFVFVFRNVGSENATGIAAVLAANGSYPGISLAGGTTLAIGNLAAGAGSAEFRIPFSAGAGVPTPTLADFTLTITDAALRTWTSNHALSVYTSSTVTGRVTSVADGLPVATALVNWTGPVSGSANVDAGGYFSFIAIDGSYSVSATAPGFVALSPAAVTTPPAPAALALQLGVPDLQVTPAAVNSTLFAGTATATSITIHNRGSAPLSWTAITATVASSAPPQPADVRPLDDPPSLAGKAIGNLGGTSSILQDLAARGATIVGLSFPLGTDDLDGIDVLIIDDSVASASAGDITLIRSWVSQGGGLFLTADNSSSMGNVNALLQETGIQESHLNGFFSGTISTILPHPSTEGVTSLSLSSYGSQCTLVGAAVPLMRDASSQTLAAASTMDSGRVIALGNEIDSSISTTGGRLFANQAVDWLARTLRWLGIPDGSGILAPGESRTLEVQLNSAGLNAGIFPGEIIILSNEPGNPRTVVPVTLTVIGSPAIAVDPASLAFPVTYVLGTSSLDLRVENPGTDALAISSLSFSNPAYATVVATPFNVAPGEDLVIPVRFSPQSTGTHAGTLTISSNSPVNPALVVNLTGQGVNGPELELDPESFTLTLPQGARHTEPLVIANPGDANLVWSAELAEAPAPAATRDHLQETLANLNANFAAVTSLIPGRFDFTDGVSGNNISDGGSDMYDNGNYLATNLSTAYLSYSDGTILANTASLGAGGRYFTRKHPGLFVFAAELDGVSTFNISGGLGADGAGTADGAILRRTVRGKSYAGFLKRVYGTSSPSVNHLVIVEDWPGISHVFSTNTNVDDHAVTGLSGTRRLYYLLFATSSGSKVGDTECAAIMDAFLRKAVPSLSWLELGAYDGTIAPAAQATPGATFDTTAIDPGQYQGLIEFASNDPARPTASIPVSLAVTAAPVIGVLPNPVEFAGVPVDSAAQSSVTIRNTGDLPLILSGASTSGSAAFTVAPLDATVVAPGGSTRLQVLFSPVSPGSHQGTLLLASNSPVSPQLEIPLNGTAVTGGVLRGTPASLDLTLVSGTTGTLPLTLRNTGSQAVAWTATHRSGEDSATTDLRGLSVALVASSATNVTAVQTALVALGATAQYVSYTTITQAVLAPFDVAILDSSVESMTAAQITAVASWIAGGGSVLAHSSSSSVIDQNTLFTPFGITLSPYYHSISVWTPAGDHFLTAGINLVTHDYANNRVALTANAVPLLREPAGNITAAISEKDGARIAVLGAAMNSFTGENQLFFGRLVGWLGRKVAWLDMTPSGGTLAALGSSATTVSFDARDLFAGTYTADLVVKSTSPAESRLIPVRLRVTGTPDIGIVTPVVQFPPVHVGFAIRTTVSIVNEGTAPLRIESVGVPHPDIKVLTPLPAVVAPRTTLEITTEFRPTSVHSLSGSLVIASNDPDTPSISLPVAGTSAIAPAAVTPASLALTAASGQVATGSFSIGNTGGSALSWSLEFGSAAIEAPLELVLPGLDAAAATLGSLIPGKYSFSDGITGTSITDGGNDMFDGGNFLTTNLVSTGAVPYSDGTVVPSAAIFGPQGRYFTRKHDGLFVLAADLDGVDTFKVYGNLGADGAGTADGGELALVHRGVAWRGFVKRVSGPISSPSVNHLVIVPDRPGLAHSFPADTNNDAHEVTGLAGTGRLYYLLYAGSNGGYIGDAEAKSLMRSFLDSIVAEASWMSAAPATGVTPAGGNTSVSVAADATLLYAGTYQTNLNIELNDPIRPSVNIPVTLTVTGEPRIVADPGYLSFPPTILGAARTMDLAVHNSGSAVLTISALQLGGRFTTESAFPVHVPPGESARIPVRYTPGMLGFEAGLATIQSNAANLPTVFVQLYGLGIPAPSVTVDRTEIAASMGAGTARNEQVRISNPGQSNLHWEAGIDYGQAMPLFDRLDLSGLTVRIISQSSSADRFDTLVAELNRLGADADEIYYSTFTPALLESTDVMLIDYSLGNLSDANLQAINGWVSNGGGLMLAGDSSSIADFNRLTLGSGILLESAASMSSTVLTDIRYDITTVGVTSITTGGTIYTRLVTSGNAKPLALWNNGNRYAATGPLGTGRIVAACGDFAYDSYVAVNSGNLRFAANSMAWLAGRVRNWVEPVPPSGVTGVNASAPLTFAFDSTGLVPGTYFAEAVVRTNDPARPEIRLPLSLEVTSTPEITPGETSLDFDPLVVGSSLTRTLTVRNTGHGVLVVSSADAPDGFAVGAAFPIILEPGRSASLDVTFAPATTGLHGGPLVLHSNATTSPALAVPLSGVGLAAPVLVVSPPQVNVGAVAGVPLARSLGLENAGPGHLAWRAADFFAGTTQLAYPPVLAGTRIGFLTSTSSYTTIRTKLAGYGGVIVNVAAPVSQATLDSLKVLVIDDNFSSSLTATDHTRIRSWVKSGGSLMLTAETTTVLAPLLEGTGITPVYYYRSGNPVTTPSQHHVTTGVTSVAPSSPEAHFTLGGSAVPLLKFSTGESYAAAARFSRGQVIAIGNEALGDGDFTIGQGERFAVQCLDWLSRRVPWLDTGEASGSTPPGGVDQIPLFFDPAGVTPGLIHRATLVLASNDPARPSLSVPISFFVSATATAAAFAEWQLDHAGGPAGFRSGFSEDWNQDGLSNGIEFYFAIHPSGPRDHLPAMAREAGQMVYRYTRDSSLPDEMLSIRHSSNLATWVPLSSAALGQTVIRRDNGDGTTTVELRFLPTAGRGFFSFQLANP